MAGMCSSCFVYIYRVSLSPRGVGIIRILSTRSKPISPKTTWTALQNRRSPDNGDRTGNTRMPTTTSSTYTEQQSTRFDSEVTHYSTAEDGIIGRFCRVVVAPGIEILLLRHTHLFLQIDTNFS